MKPICVKCQRFYRPKKNGITLLEKMPDGMVPRALPGTAEPARWSPYKLWMGDLWECQGCGSQIVVGTGVNPLSEHFKPDFAAELEYAGADVITVNDC